MNLQPIVQIGPIVQVTVNLCATNNFGAKLRMPVAREEAGYYGGALRESEMRKALHGLHYSDLNIDGSALPYSVDALFLESKSVGLSELEKWCCQRSEDLVIKIDDHPLQDSALPAELAKAYKRRKWSQMEQWLAGSGGDDSRNLIRFEKVDPEEKRVTWARTTYSTQAVTNLVMDMEVADKPSLRWLTKPSSGLPPLADRRLSNNLGISVLVLADDGTPIIPLRNPTGVAVFPNEWGASLSTAARCPNPENVYTLADLVLPALQAMFKEEFASESKVFQSRLIPLALCREWFRGGKPQIFLALESDISVLEAGRRLGKAEHSSELKSRSGLGSWILDKVSDSHKRRLNDFTGASEKYSIEVLANLALYEAWRAA